MLDEIEKIILIGLKTNLIFVYKGTTEREKGKREIDSHKNSNGISITSSFFIIKKKNQIWKTTPLTNSPSPPPQICWACVLSF